jgi:hypothetical protein
MIVIRIITIIRGGGLLQVFVATAVSALCVSDPGSGESDLSKINLYKFIERDKNK